MGTFFTTLGFAVVFITTPRRPRPRRPNPETFLMDGQTRLLIPTLQFLVLVVERKEKTLKNLAVEVNNGFLLVVFLP